MLASGDECRRARQLPVQHARNRFHIVIQLARGDREARDRGGRTHQRFVAGNHGPARVGNRLRSFGNSGISQTSGERVSERLEDASGILVRR